jgi:DNA-binding MarR family transcriptional regulator
VTELKPGAKISRWVQTGAVPRHGGGRLLERAHERREGAVRAFRLEDHLFSVSVRFRRAARGLSIRVRRCVNYARWRILAVLQELSGATMGRLADLTSVDATALTSTLGLMEKAGLVVRRERKSDRRSLAIFDGQRSTKFRARSAADPRGNRSGVDRLLIGGNRGSERSATEIANNLRAS